MPPTTMSKTMKAFVHHPNATNLVLENLDIPEPGPNEVLLFYSPQGLPQLHILDGQSAAPIVGLTYVMGHETAGVVVKNGAGATADVGQLYTVLGINPCITECSHCRDGRHNLCTTARQFIGLGRNGGFAEYVAVPQTAIVAVPKGVSPTVAAAAADAILTPYHSLKTRGRVQPGMKVAIIGLGGLGLNAVEIALVLGAQVWATDLKASSIAAAQKLGAKAMSMNELKKEATNNNFDVVLDAVGIESTFEAAQEMVGKNGLVLVQGLGSRNLTFNTSIAVLKETTISVTFWGTKSDLKEALDLIAEGKLNPQVVSAPLIELPSYVEKMRKGQLGARVAFIP